MSLKIFHIIFVIATVLLALLCAYWAFAYEGPAAFGYVSLAAAAGMVVYGFWFLRKARKIIV